MSNTILEDFDIEVSSKVAKMKENLELLLQNLSFLYDLELGKIPIPIRKLKVSEFCSKYNADFKTYFDSQFASELNASLSQLPGPTPKSISTKATRSTRKQAALKDITNVKSDPKATKTTTKTTSLMRTVSKTRASTRTTAKVGRPRANEVFETPSQKSGSYFNFGSEYFTTPSQTLKISRDPTGTIQKRIAIGLKDGNVVDIDPTLSPSELKNSLTKESKEELYSHLTVLQLQLQSLMEKITEPN